MDISDKYDSNLVISLEDVFYDSFTQNEKQTTNKKYAKQFLEKLKNYKMLEKSDDQTINILLETFVRNLVAIMSTNLKLDLLKIPKNQTKLESASK